MARGWQAVGEAKSRAGEEGRGRDKSKEGIEMRYHGEEAASMGNSG